MLTIFIFIGLCLIVSGDEVLKNSPIHVPISGRIGTIDRSDHLSRIDLHFNMTIGSPGLEFMVKINHGYDSHPYLFVAYTRFIEGIGSVGYNPERSSSFVQTKEQDDEVSGTETFQINGVTLKQKPFKLDNSKFDFEQPDQRLALMDINHNVACDSGKKCPSFVQSVLEDQKEQILTFAFNDISNIDDGEEYDGTLVFGDKAPKLCQSDWFFTPEVTRHRLDQKRWDFKIDKITIGDSFSYTGKSLHVGVAFSDRDLYLPDKVMNKALERLGAKYGKTVPCKTTEDIVFHLGGKEIRVSPEIYVIKTWDDDEEECRVRMTPTYDGVVGIPDIAFANHCIALDFKNFKIGFTKRI